MRFTNVALVTGLLSITQANNILFYEYNTCNAGAYSGCYNIGANICCYTTAEDEAGAISISKGPLDFATMWSGGGCKNQQCSAGGSGTFCCIWNYRDLLTGGLFVTLSGNKGEDPQSAVNCTGKMDANVFGYASGANTAWEIHQEYVGESFSQLHQEFQTVSSDQKEAWLQAHGAVHNAQVHDSPPKIAFSSADT